MAIDGNFLAEKEHVLSDMSQRMHALAEDRVLTQEEKERVITTAVCTVFRHSTGFVDWSRAELDRISKMWHCLRQQFFSRGRQTLKQLQLLVRISGRAESALELLLLRLDEQGLDISSPWRINGDDSIGSVL
jgi:hypothetical protein